MSLLVSRPVGPVHFDTNYPHNEIESRCDFIQPGDVALHPKLVLDGWAAGYRVTFDGRRQLTNLYLPGELIGVWRTSQPSFHHAVMAITRLSLKEITVAPDDSIVPVECALVERQLENSVFRLGCLNAYERLAHLFLELGERLQMRGHGTRSKYAMPLTQDLLADLVGMTSVHVNRTLQQMRADGAIRLSGGQIEILAPNNLVDQVSYQSIS